MAVGDVKIADVMVDNYASLKLKHPQRENCSVPHLQISIVSQPRSFLSTRLSCLSPTALVQGWMAFRTNLNRFDCQVERANWTEFSQSLKKSCEYDSRRKSTFELQPYFFVAKLIALKKVRWLSDSNTFRRLSAKCAGYHVFESHQARYENRQVGVGTKRAAELASHIFRCLIENP